MIEQKDNCIDRVLFKIKPLYIFIGLIILLLICFFAILLFDVYNLGGVRTFLEEMEIGAPRVWPQLFGTAGPIEMIESLLLGILGLLSMYVSGRLIGQEQNRLGYFWFLIGFFALLLFMEEAANVSNRYMAYMSYLNIGSSIVGSRIIFFLFYMIFALLPFVLFFKDIFQFKKSFTYLVAGYFFYGIAAIQSEFLKLIGIKRGILGDYLIQNIFDGQLYFYSATGEDLGNLFVDHVIEEPIELLSICLLLSALLAFIQSKKLKSTTHDHRRN